MRYRSLGALWSGMAVAIVLTSIVTYSVIHQADWDSCAQLASARLEAGSAKIDMLRGQVEVAPNDDLEQSSS